MFLKGIGAPELILILVIVIIVFGVGRLGEVGGAIGGAIREFRKATSGDEQAKKDEAEKKDSAKKDDAVKS
ncbi:MAG: twin-arginine translocase TatA/TatE family subunit [Chloroflexi bacterium]|nr:twin-arginine translocase TatA/TatE family subunit [Chloroflexota bacterium]